MKKFVGLIAKLAFTVAVVYGAVELIYVFERWLDVYNIYTKWMEVAEVAAVVSITYGATTLAAKVAKKVISAIRNRKEKNYNLVIYRES